MSRSSITVNRRPAFSLSAILEHLISCVMSLLAPPNACITFSFLCFSGSTFSIGTLPRPFLLHYTIFSLFLQYGRIYPSIKRALVSNILLYLLLSLSCCLLGLCLSLFPNYVISLFPVSFVQPYNKKAHPMRDGHLVNS